MSTTSRSLSSSALEAPDHRRNPELLRHRSRPARVDVAERRHLVHLRQRLVGLDMRGPDPRPDHPDLQPHGRTPPQRHRDPVRLQRQLHRQEAMRLPHRRLGPVQHVVPEPRPVVELHARAVHVPRPLPVGQEQMVPPRPPLGVHVLPQLDVAARPHQEQPPVPPDRRPLHRHPVHPDEPGRMLRRHHRVPVVVPPLLPGIVEVRLHARQHPRRRRPGEMQELLELVRGDVDEDMPAAARCPRTSPAAGCGRSGAARARRCSPPARSPPPPPAATRRPSPSAGNAPSSRPTRSARCPPASAAGRRAAPPWCTPACPPSRPCRPASRAAPSPPGRRGCRRPPPSAPPGSSRISRSSATRLACG